MERIISLALVYVQETKGRRHVSESRFDNYLFIHPKGILQNNKLGCINSSTKKMYSIVAEPYNK